MHRTLSRALSAALLVWLIVSTPASEKTALDRYVAAPDPNYAFKLVNKMHADGATVFVLEMTSQQFLTTNEVDKPIWKHWLTIVKPDEVTTSTGFLFITGGANDRPAPNNPDPNMARIAIATKSVVT